MIQSPDYYKPILERLKIEALNPMQIEMWDTALTDQDIILLSPTGTGKTLAFLLPLTAKIDPSIAALQALIIAPTRELAMQINSVLKSMSTGIKSTLCYGGHPLKEEKKSLDQKPNIVIGTPGRIYDHIRRGHFDSNDLKLLVFDEFDKSLELGFQEDMKEIVRFPSAVNQFLFTSATEALEIPDFIGLKALKKIDYIANESTSTNLRIQKVISPEKDKIKTLISLVSGIGTASALVFLNYRAAVERVHNLLKAAGIESEYFHGGLDQKDREIKLMKFRNGSVQILITTDLSARGLDIPAVKYVIHYQMPDKEAQFIHRNGRTARMNATGTAIVLISESEDLKPYVPPTISAYEIDEQDGSITATSWVTIEFNKGKKDKINKIDVLGYLTKVCGLNGSEVGQIEIKPYRAYVAIDRAQLDLVKRNGSDKKIKGKSVKISII